MDVKQENPDDNRRSKSPLLQQHGDHSDDSASSEAENDPQHGDIDNRAAAQLDGNPATTHTNNGAQSAQPDIPQPTQGQADGETHQATPPSGQPHTAGDEGEAVPDPKAPLEAYGWDDLEARFLKKMEECQIHEEELEKEFRQWIDVSVPLRSCSAIFLSS